MRKKLMPALAVGATVLVSGFAVAQQTETPRDQRENQRETRREQRQEDRETRGPGERRAESHDQMFAQCLAIDNSAEIQISEAAAKHLQHDQVKQFAQQMVTEHRTLLDELKKFGAEPVAFNDTAGDAANPAADVTVRTGREGAEVDVNRDGAGAQGERRIGDRAEAARDRVNDRREARQGDFLAIKQEIARECVRSAQEELTAKSGPEADKCFMAAQVFAHQHMLDALKVFERHASPEFKETLAQASQATEKHLDHAKQILKTLDSNPGSSDSSATSGTNR